MADRQERRLMRQRGAGPRDLKNAAFSFNFGAAPLPPQRSTRRTPQPSSAQISRKTPQSSLAQRPSTRKTPAGSRLRSGATPASGSRNSRKSASAAPSSGSRNSDSNGSSFKTPTVSGKRKRGGIVLAAVEETEQDELEPTAEDINASRSTNIRQSIEVPPSAQKTPGIRPLDEDQEDEPDELSPEHNGPAIKNLVREIQTPTLLRRLSERRVRSGSRGSVISTIEEDEIGEDELSFAQEQTVTIDVQTSSRNRDSSSGLAMATTITETLNVSLTAPNNQSTRREIFEASGLEETADEPIPSVEDGDEDTGEDELSPIQAERPQRSHKTAGKPPVVIEGAIEDGVSDDELSPAQPKKRSSLNRAPIEVLQDSVSEDELSPAQPKKRRPPKRTRTEVHQDVVQDEVSETDKLSPQHTRVSRKQKQPQPLASTTANVLKQGKKRKTTERATSPPRKKAKTGGGVVGITVYRRTESKNIAYDPLGADPNPGITPADVLAQVSGELAANHITAFSQSARPDNVSKKTRRRQVNALTYFRDILSDSLFELQNAHLSTHALASQLRASNRQKRQLRAELMAKRQERERLDLQIDKFRAEHREKMEKADRQHDLVQNLRDIELAVRRGREKAREEEREDEEPEVGLEMLVGSVIGSVGLLGRVREWNGVLEESAALLEARA